MYVLHSHQQRANDWFPTVSSVMCIIKFFPFLLCQSDRWEMVTGLILMIILITVSEAKHLFIWFRGHLFYFEFSSHVFTHCSTRFVDLFSLEFFTSSLYIKDISPLSVINVANVFPQFAIYLFDFSSIASGFLVIAWKPFPTHSYKGSHMDFFLGCLDLCWFHCLFLSPTPNSQERRRFENTSPQNPQEKEKALGDV